MKARRWVLALFPVVALIGLGLYYTPRLVRIDERVRALVGDYFSFEAARVGFRGVFLDGVKAGFDRPPCTISIEKVKVGYSLMRLLKSGFDPSFGVGEIVLSNPELSYRPVNSGQPTTSEDGGWGAVELSALPRARVTVVGGRVAIEGRSDYVVWDVGGWADVRDLSRVVIHLGGKTVGDGGLKVYGYGDVSEGVWDVSLEAQSVDLSGGWVGVFAGDLSPRSGRADLSLKLLPEISGQVSIAEATISPMDIGVKIESLDVSGEIVGGSLVLKEASGSLLGAELRASGQLELLNKPTAHLRLEVLGLNVEEFASLMIPNRPTGSYLPSGRGSLVANIDGPLDDLKMTGIFETGRISYNRGEVGDLKVKFVATGSELIVESASGTIGGRKVGGRGEFSLEGDEISIQGTAEAIHMDLGQVQRFWNGEGLVGSVDLKVGVGGSLSRPLYRVRYRTDGLTFLGRRLPDQDGSLKYDGEKIQFRSLGEWEAASGLLLSPFEKPSLEASLKLDGLPLGFLPGKVSGEANFKGGLSSLDMTGKFRFDGGAEVGGGFFVQGNIRDLLSGELKIGAEVSSSEGFHVGRAKLNFGAKILADKERIDISLSEAEGKAQLVASVDRRSDMALEGEVTFRDLPVFDLLGVQNVGGRLSGSYGLEGTLESPRALGRSEVRAGQIGSIDSLTAELNVGWENGTLKVEDCTLLRKAERLVGLEGSWTPSRGLNIEAHLKEPSSLSLLQVEEHKVEGRLSSFDASFSQEGDSTKFEAAATIEDGEAYEIPFDKMALKVGGDSHWLEITDFKAESRGRYEASVQGGVPFFGGIGEKELDIKAELEGDLFSLLPRGDVIRDASGDARLSFRIGGRWDKPLIREMEIDLRGGEVRPALLADKVSNLTGRMKMEDGSRFVRIESLSGEIDGDEISIRNLEELMRDGRPVLIDGEPLQPLVIDGLNLSLGVLVIETTEDGVKLSIPPIMGPSNTGRFKPLGRAEDESFYIGTRGGALTVRGRVEVSDAELTYPFLEPKPGEPSFDFVNTIYWDMIGVVKGNVRYFRELPIIDDLPEAELGWVSAEVQKGDSLDFRRMFDDGTFYFAGHVRANQGTITYIDSEFRVEEGGVEVDTQYGEYPRFYGEARTTVYDDSTGAPTDISLELYAIDEETGTEVNEAPWGKFRFRLTSSDPDDDSQEKILAKLGYASGKYEQKAIGAALVMGESILLRPILRPVERKVKSLGVDVFYIRPSVALNLLNEEGLLLGFASGLADLSLFRGTRFTIGEYFLRNWFLSYSGELEVEGDRFENSVLGIRHRLGLEYLIRARTKLEFKYGYDGVLGKEGIQYGIKHHFDF